MSLKASVLAAVLILGVGPTAPALACGDGEAPTSCDDPSPNGFASWMLGRLERAPPAGRVWAPQEFLGGARGFRNAATDVFCIGPDGIMSAHPNPILKGHD